MQPIELSFVQALKFLWSVVWRTWLLMIPLWAVAMGAMVWMIPFPKPGEPPMPPDLSKLPAMFGLWLVLMIGYLVILALALRWALKAKWSDFRIIAVATMPPANESSAP
jgi:hypothetical protein